MQTVNETNAPNSVTGSGQKSTGFRGLKALFRWLGSKSRQSKDPYTIVLVEDDLVPGGPGFFVVEDRGYGATYTGPYKREQDAKGVRTRLIKQHG
jgi:hypothetical protein